MESAAHAQAPTALDAFWARVDDHFRSKLNADLYARWFRALRPVSLEGDRLRVAAPDKFHRDFVEDNYRAWFEEFLPVLAGRALRVAFAVDDAPRPPPAPAAEPARPLPSPATTPVPADGEARDTRPSPRYLFDTFVVGGSNEFAVAAARAVSEKPGRAWNPLFLHGASGLGKTHLLHAVANAILQQNPGGRVAIVSSERYTNEFVAALSKGTAAMEEFRRKYRECAALLVDDVQFLAGKEKTAEEFFHTFNDLHAREVQIVLSSDRSPKDLKGLEERLCSRFNWGMRVQIEPPEFETRAAILRKKAEVERLDLPADACELLATHIRSNVRELEGALMRLAAFSSLKNERISVALARDVLADVIPPVGYRPSIEKIQEAVAARFGLTVAKLTSGSRERKVAQPRQVAMFLCREIAGETFQSIAEKFNKGDHTTVISAVDRARELIETDPEFRTAVEKLRKDLQP